MQINNVVTNKRIIVALVVVVATIGVAHYFGFLDKVFVRDTFADISAKVKGYDENISSYQYQKYWISGLQNRGGNVETYSENNQIKIRIDTHRSSFGQMVVRIYFFEDIIYFERDTQTFSFSEGEETGFNDEKVSESYILDLDHQIKAYQKNGAIIKEQAMLNKEQTAINKYFDYISTVKLDPNSSAGDYME